ncbi:enoyl-CoA hydratase/isomerase family protein [Hoeflea sp.]|uniref:enoyl-CoA hydratase/isomerase family protein n=1 Tax=Hoeflea sp. TaxID=1940281 RepID=UPI003B02C9C1
MSEDRLHPNLVLHRHGPVEILRVDREEAMGALNLEILTALGDYVNGLYQRKDEVRVLILTGTGRSFVAGTDKARYQSARQTVFDEFQRRYRMTFEAVANLPQATICAVNGYALGGGFELALCCDFVFVNEKTKLGLPEIRLGLLPDGGGTRRLPGLVGPMRAREILVTGRMINARQAVEYGVALEACAPDKLMARAMEFADGLAQMAPVALREALRVADDGLDAALTAGLTMEQRAPGALLANEDGKQAIGAFIDKREPVFKGR